MNRTLAVLLVGLALSAFFSLELKLLRGTTLNPQLCPGTQPQPHELEQLHSCADDKIKQLLWNLDTHTLYLFHLFKATYEADDPNTNIPTAAQLMKLPVPKQRYNKIHLGLTYPTAQGEFNLAVPSDDTEDWPGYEHSIGGLIPTFLFAWLRFDLLHPVRDLHLFWASADQGRRALAAAVGHDVDQRLLVKNTDHVSDQAIARWAFSGIAAQRLQCPGVTGYRLHEITMVKMVHSPDPEEYCLVDMMWLSGLPVREGFMKYGATAYFNSNRTISKIQHEAGTFRPSDSGWEDAKWIWKSSVLVGVTVRDHLTNVHLMVANQLTIASRENLPENHPIRRLIKPFTYNTIGINIGASKTLAVKNSLVHRATAFTWEGMQAGFSLLLATDRDLPLAPDYMALRGTDKLPLGVYPFGEDWIAFYDVVHQFVWEYVDVYYQDNEQVRGDSELQEFYHQIQLPEHVESTRPHKTLGASKHTLKLLLTGMFVTVTGVHNQVGNIAEYLCDPSYTTGKLRQGARISDVQSSFQALNIALSTASKQPMLLDNVDHMLSDQRAVAVWGVFRERLLALSNQLEERNLARGDFKSNSMNPRKMVFSVSI